MSLPTILLGSFGFNDRRLNHKTDLQDATRGLVDSEIKVENLERFGALVVCHAKLRL
jgi:hypothetical protein